MSIFALRQTAVVPPSRPRSFVGYLIPPLSTALLTSLLLVFPPLSTYPLVFFVIPVAVSAWLGGLWPGVLASVLSLLSADYFFIPPLHAVDLQHKVPLFGFLVVGALTSAIMEEFHAAHRRLESLLSSVESQRSALAESQDRLRVAHAEFQRTSEQQVTSEHEGRKRAEAALRSTAEQLLQAQKMEAVGRLAGGVAHDFNNLLSVILSYSTRLLREAAEHSRARNDLEEVLKAAQRATELTRQLLAFSRQQVLQPKVVDLNQVADGMKQMIERLIGEDVRLSMRLSPGIGKVMCDPGQLELVVMNLVVNARDAMPTGGLVTIVTRMTDSDEANAQAALETTAASYVTLAVSDTGMGIDAQTRDRIFEPFFTTKEKGRGTGLGLSTVYGIVKQSGGNIRVESSPGHGTTFTIYLPQTDAQGHDLVASPRPVPRRGSEKVLLVEDEDQLRRLMREILEDDGYQVLVARNGAEALLVCEQEAGSIDLVVTDVVMPVMRGRELVERLARIRPETRVLFVSGYSDDTVGDHGVLDSGVAFLQKPITAEMLLDAVRGVLDASVSLHEEAIARINRLLGSMLAAPPISSGPDKLTIKVKAGMRRRAGEILDANGPWPSFVLELVE